MLFVVYEDKDELDINEQKVAENKDYYQQQVALHRIDRPKTSVFILFDKKFIGLLLAYIVHRKISVVVVVVVVVKNEQEIHIVSVQMVVAEVK